MEQNLLQLLASIEKFGNENDAATSDRSRKMLNLEQPTAALLSILTRTSRARSILEIGTSNGYSTIWLAWSVVHHGGRVTTIERNPEKQALARTNVSQAGFSDTVDFQLGDATEIVRRLQGPFDLVFFDADRLMAPEQLSLLLPKLTNPALILADNVLSHPDEIAPYLKAIEEIPNTTHIVVPVGKGLSIAYRD